MSDPGHMKQSKMGVLPSRSLQFSRKKNTELIKTPHPTIIGAKRKKSSKQHVKEAKRKRQTSHHYSPYL